MSLREEAIKQHFDKEIAKKMKFAKEKAEQIDKALEFARKQICEKFKLEKAPDFRLVPFDGRFWPDCFFDIDGITFEYVLGNDNFRVEVICDKCQHTEMVPFGIQVSSGIPDFSRLGEALIRMTSGQHRCPVDQPPEPAPVPLSPPRTIEYTIGCAEVRLLEAFDELVFDAIERHQN